MDYKKVDELLKKFKCVEHWETKSYDNSVYCLDMTIEGKGWVRLYSSCNGNLNSNVDIFVDEINEKEITNLLNDYKNIKMKWEISEGQGR